MNFKAILITVWIWVPALATAYETESDPFLVCHSPECNQRAKLLNESLNTTIDPCTNFYSYVCGRWESNYNLPSSGRNSYDVYDEIHKDIPETLSYILGNRTLVESNQSIIDKLAIMYNACLALTDPPDTLIRVLNESGFNSWPIITEKNIFNASNCTDLLRHMNMSAVLYADVIDMKIYAKTWAYPYEMTLGGMPVQQKIMKVPNIRVVIKNTIKLLNPGMDSLTLENLTNQLEEFANNLSKITEESGTHKAYTISSLEATFPNVPISELLTKEFRKVNMTLKDTDTFEVYDLIYYNSLNTFLAIANPNTLYNYAGFLAVFPYIQYVQMSTEDAVSSELTQSKTQGRNWSECIALLDKTTPDLLDYLYVTNHANPVIKTEVENIAHRLKQAFNETLQNSSWMDKEMRKTLQKKLEEMPWGIGYQDMLLNMSALETRYKYVPSFPVNISFTEAFYYFQENLYNMQLRKLQYPAEGDLGWDHSPRDGRPFHVKYGTKIEIPYEIFVPPFFQQRLPRSLNYGGIGGTIAYELAYSFMKAIRSCVARPRCKYSFTRESVDLFDTRTPCFKEQYKAAAETLLPELSKKPSWFWGATLDEDLADNTGLHTAFTAYYEALQEECDGKDTRLAGLENITGIQLFFISYARPMCKTAYNTALINEIGRGYSPASSRVNEAMKNFQGFAEAFNCSRYSPMNPEKKCTLW